MTAFGSFFSRNLCLHIRTHGFSRSGGLVLSSKQLRSQPLHNTCYRRSFQQKSLQKGNSSQQNNLAGGLLKRLAFVVGVSGCTFAGAAIWQYEHLRSIINRKRNRENRTTSDNRRKAQMKDIWDNFVRHGKHVAAVIIGINTAVFLAWKVPALQNTLIKYFLSSSVKGSSYFSLLGSSFSQISGIHIFMNMYCLWSIMPWAGSLLGTEQTTALYISGGVVSAYASYVFRILSKSVIPSLGASGAILALFGMCAVNSPNQQVKIAIIGDIFPHSFELKNGVVCLVILDCLGLMFGWTKFDHMAHLSAVLFGAWYAKYGPKYIWTQREGLLKQWHKLRGNPVK